MMEEGSLGPACFAKHNQPSFPLTSLYQEVEGPVRLKAVGLCVYLTAVASVDAFRTSHRVRILQD